MIRKIAIDGKEITFSASAATPRQYRDMFMRDLLADMQYLAASLESGAMEIRTLEMFENVAFIMAKSGAKEAGEDFPYDSPDEWLEQFNVMSVYEFTPQLLDLWNLNTKTLVDHKKKARRRRGKCRQHSSN